MNQNEHKLVEDKLKKINNQIEVDQDFGDSDEMLITSRRHSDDETGDQVLGNLEYTSEDTRTMKIWKYWLNFIILIIVEQIPLTNS